MSKAADLPARSELARLFRYDEESGVLYWRHRPDRRRSWNTRYADTPAGSDCGHGYLKVSIGKRLFYVHHVVWVLTRDEPLPPEIDHENLCRGDNFGGNLRAATRRQNGANRPGYAASGLKGAYRLPSGRFYSRLVRKYLGSFDTAEQAHLAYVDAAKKAFGQFARA